MNREIFLDTSFIQAFLNQSDQYRLQALKYASLLQTAHRLWVTEAVLSEVGDALSRIDRIAAIKFIDDCDQAKNIIVVNVTTPLFKRATLLYRNRPDKEWGLTDCISFVVMQEQGLTEALTADKHFVQAGYKALLLETN